LRSGLVGVQPRRAAQGPGRRGGVVRQDHRTSRQRLLLRSPDLRRDVQGHPRHLRRRLQAPVGRFRAERSLTMSMPPPGPSAGEPSRYGPDPAGTPGRAPAAKKSRAPRLIVLLVVGVVALLAAGIGAFLMARDYRTYQVVQGCGPYNCIPALKAGTVIE